MAVDLLARGRARVSGRQPIDLLPDPGLVEETQLPPSRTGLVPEDIRRDVRSAMEAAPGAVGFAAEASPAMAGGTLGFMAGSPFGPVGAFIGVSFGALVG